MYWNNQWVQGFYPPIPSGASWSLLSLRLWMCRGLSWGTLGGLVCLLCFQCDRAVSKEHFWRRGNTAHQLGPEWSSTLGHRIPGKMMSRTTAMLFVGLTRYWCVTHIWFSLEMFTCNCSVKSVRHVNSSYWENVCRWFNLMTWLNWTASSSIVMCFEKFWKREGRKLVSHLLQIIFHSSGGDRKVWESSRMKAGYPWLHFIMFGKEHR